MSRGLALPIVNNDNWGIRVLIHCTEMRSRQNETHIFPFILRSSMGNVTVFRICNVCLLQFEQGYFGLVSNGYCIYFYLVLIRKRAARSLFGDFEYNFFFIFFFNRDIHVFFIVYDFRYFFERGLKFSFCSFLFNR